MFNNRFNSSKNDPLVEAVKQAQADGDMRRQAVAAVNEQFGVFSRNAVVREDLAAYDAAIEEAYKCMKEGKPVLAKKDYDKDGKIESPKDEVWGSRFRAAKAAGKMEEEEQIDEISKELAGKYIKHADYKRSESSFRSGKVYGKELATKRRTKQDVEDARKHNRDSFKREKGINMAVNKLTGKAKVSANEEIDYSAPDRAAVTKDNKPVVSSTASQASTSGPSASDKAALTSKIKSMNEAKYSAKAARAGEDIGKPGKNFEKIAKKAGEKYGSEERGKKVAGAILKKIRAKHMKEESQIDEVSAFGQAFRAAGGKNFTFGGKSYSGARADGKSSSAPTPPSRPAGLGANKEIGDAGYKSGQTVSLKPIGDTGSAMAADNKPEPARPAPTPGWKSPAPVDQAKTIGASGGEAPIAPPKVAPTPPSRPADLGGSAPAAKPMQNPDQNITKVMKESVQVGVNKYRIV